MSRKTLIYIFLSIGSTVGAYTPALWGDSSLFSFSSVILTAVGGIVGIWVGFKLSNYF